jgi:hypothetical protein
MKRQNEMLYFIVFLTFGSLLLILLLPYIAERL